MFDVIGHQKVWLDVMLALLSQQHAGLQYALDFRPCCHPVLWFDNAYADVDVEF